MRVELCAIAKNEHEYISEWVSHYLKLGFDKITIYDNDDIDNPYIGDFIKKEDLSKVKIISVRGIHKQCFQHECYDDFYHSNRFDWALFCDIDEYLSGVKDIKSFLRQPKFASYNQIRVKWVLFGDDDEISRDMSKPIFGHFKKMIVDNRLSNQGKSFIRGGLNIKIQSCHFAKALKSCYPNGKGCQAISLDILNYDFQTVYMFHYMTKTLEEFVKQKLNRGDAVWEKRTINMEYYWRINKKTKEKIEYLKSMGLEI